MPDCDIRAQPAMSASCDCGSCQSLGLIQSSSKWARRHDGRTGERQTTRIEPRNASRASARTSGARVKELAYQETPVGCLREVAVLAALTKNLMHRIVCPTLVIHSREDHIVPVVNAMEIVTTIRSDDIRLLWPNNSYHVATLDNDKDLILDRVGGFFTEIAKVAPVERATLE
jgi:carboxylesterase